MSSSTEVGTPTGSPALTNARSIKCHNDVLAATQELLAEGGLHAATIDAISERSTVSKATIYKHWPSRIAVAAEAFSISVRDALPTPDTGNIVDDLTEHVRNVSMFYATPRGKVFTQLLAACVDDEAGADYFKRYYLDGRRALTSKMWERAVERGEVDPANDIHVVGEVLFGPMALRLITGSAPFDAAQAEQFARVALHGLLSVP